MRFANNNWKLPTVLHCQLKGATHSVFVALVLAAKSNFRVYLPYRDIAALASVSPMSCMRALKILTDRHYVEVLEQGKGRRPTMLKVAKWTKTTEPLVVTPDETKTKSKTKSVVVTFETASSL